MPESSPDVDIRRFEQRLAELQALIQVIGQVNRSLNVDDVLQASLDGIQRALDGQFGCFLLIQPVDHRLELAHARSVPPALLESLQRTSTRFLPSAALSAGQDPSDLTIALCERVREILQAEKRESATLIPLTARGRPVGVLLVDMGTRRVLMPLSIDLLMSIGEQVGMAIENARLHASLAESEQFHRALVENSPEGIWEGDRTGRILYVNDAACKIMGYARAELLQMHPGDFPVNPRDLWRARREFLRLDSFSSRILKCRAKGGAIKILSISAHLVRNPHGDILRYQSIFRDVTEQQQGIEILDRRNLELSALNAIGNILSHPLEISRAFDQVCEQIALITGMETAAIFLNAESGQTMRLVAYRGIDADLLGEVQQIGLDDPLTHSIAVKGQIVAADDVMLYATAGLAGPRRAGYHAGIGIPIRYRDQPTGAVFVGSKTRLRYEKTDVALLLNVGERIGMALENHNLYAEMQRHVDELDGLAQLSAACTSSLDPKAISQLAVEWTRELLKGDISSLHLLEGDSMRLNAILGQREGVTIEERLKIGERGYSFLTMRAPLIVGDTDHDTLISQGPRAVLEANGVRAIVVMPLPTPNRTIGILTIGHTHPHVWQQREIDLLQTVANQTANAIHNAQLFQNILNEQRKVQAIFDSGISGLYATDAEGRIAMFNRAAERITGWSRQEVLGKLWDDVFVDPTAPRPAEPLIRLALVRKQTAYFPDGKQIQTRDGRIIPVAKAVAPLIDDGGRVTGAVGALWDLTREKAAERSRENFLRMVAHQMRNPLTVLVSALALLDNPHLPKKRRAEMYDLVKSQAERLKTFSEQFLDLEKALHSESAVAMEPVAILPLIHQLIGEFQAEHPGYHFYVEGGQPEPIVLANPDRLDNILRNLLDNAVTYSPESRPITVSTQVPEEGDRVDIAIRDEGIGIPFPDQEHIFDAFYRASQPEGRQTYGHGFGLFIARQMARQMDGDIEFTSQEHQGSTFHLILRRSSHGESEYDSSRG